MTITPLTFCIAFPNLVLTNTTGNEKLDILSKAGNDRRGSGEKNHNLPKVRKTLKVTFRKDCSDSWYLITVNVILFERVNGLRKLQVGCYNLYPSFSYRSIF